MPNEKRQFQKMNLDDADEFLQNGEYKEARNVRVNITADGENGYLTNMNGVVEDIDFRTDHPFDSSFVHNRSFVVGVFSDDRNNRLFIFVARPEEGGVTRHGIYTWDGDVFDVIAEERITQSKLFWHKTINGYEQVASILDFRQDFPIKNVTLVDNILTWTDDFHPPKSLDITKSPNLDDSNNSPVWLDGLVEWAEDVKIPPVHPPRITQRSRSDLTSIGQSDLIGKQNFKGRNYQFCYRYVFYDKSKSVFSPASQMIGTTYKEFPGLFRDVTSDDAKIEALDIFFDNPALEDANGNFLDKYTNIITHIEVAYRDYYTNNWKYFKRLAFPVAFYRFQNNDGYSTLANEEVDKPYDAVPLAAKAVEATKSKKFYGNCLEGFDTIDFNTENHSVDQRPEKVRGYNQTLKPYSQYQFGFVFKDYAGRKSGVYTNESLSFYTEDERLDRILGLSESLVDRIPYPRIEFSIPANIQPPEWAESYDIVRKDNSDYTFFLQVLTNNLKYRQKDDTGQYVDVNTDADIIGFSPQGEFIYRGGKDSEGNIFMNNGRKHAPKQDSYSVDNGNYWVCGSQIDGYLFFRDNNRTSSGVYTRDCNRFVVFDETQGIDACVNNYPAEWVIGESVNGGNLYYGGLTFPLTGGGDYYYSQEGCGNFWSDIHGGNHPGGDLRNTTPAATFVPEATELWIDISNITKSGLAYSFTEGDKVRLLGYVDPEEDNPQVIQYSPFDQEELTGNHDAAVFDILRQEGEFIVVSWSQDKLFFLDQPVNLIEIFSPKDSQEEIFYDTGLTYSVLNPHTPQRDFAIRDYRLQLGGDTHIIERSFSSTNNTSGGDGLIVSPKPYSNLKIWLHAMNSNDEYFERWDKGLGRPNVVFEGRQSEERRRGLIRYSRQYIQNSDINNLNSFDLDRTEEVPVEWGGITQLTAVDNIMIANCENEAVSMYIDEKAIKDVTGQDTLGLSDQVINNIRKLSGGYGCIHQNSVTLYNSSLYWFSQNKSAVCRFNFQNQIYPISNYKARKFFDEKARTHQDKIITGGFDPYYQVFLLTFGYDEAMETIGFQEGVNGWISFYDIEPRFYGYILNDLMSTTGSKLFRHDRGDTNMLYNLIGDISYAGPSVKVVFNQQPSVQKIFNNIHEEGNDVWTCTIRTPKGQETYLIRDDFELINNELWADVLCDANTPGVTLPVINGDFMGDNIAEVIFENDSSEHAYLFMVNLHSQVNFRTNQ